MQDVTGKNELEEFIWENYENNVVLLYFGAEWCGPCKTLKNRLAIKRKALFQSTFGVVAVV